MRVAVAAQSRVQGDHRGARLRDRVQHLGHARGVVDPGAHLRRDRQRRGGDGAGDDGRHRLRLREHRGSGALIEYHRRGAAEIQVDPRRPGGFGAGDGPGQEFHIRRHQLDPDGTIRAQGTQVASHHARGNRRARDADEFRARSADTAEIDHLVAEHRIGDALHWREQQRWIERHPPTAVMAGDHQWRGR
jgi:hypothetical protein